MAHRYSIHRCSSPIQSVRFSPVPTNHEPQNSHAPFSMKLWKNIQPPISQISIITLKRLVRCAIIGNNSIANSRIPCNCWFTLCSISSFFSAIIFSSYSFTMLVVDHFRWSPWLIWFAPLFFVFCFLFPVSNAVRTEVVCSVFGFHSFFFFFLQGVY